MSNSAIIVAAGMSERFGDNLPKQFHEIAGKPLLSWTIEAFEQAESIRQVLVVSSGEYLEYITEKVIDPYKFMKVNKVVEGGRDRAESVMNGLKALNDSTKIVAIHDGVRPLVNSDDINKVVSAAKESRAAMLAVRSKDTVKRVAIDQIIETIDRNQIWMAQTPQAFEYKLIFEAHRKAKDNKIATDDSLLVEQLGVKVKVFEPSSCNLKVTTKEDLLIVKSILERRKNA